jgi:hypothetical protein
MDLQETIVFKCSKEDKAKLTKLAAENRMTLSSYVRTELLNEKLS